MERAPFPHTSSMSGITNRATRRYLALGAASVVAASIAIPQALSQRADAAGSPEPPHLPLSQYQHDRWTTADGLPNHSIDWMVQSPDGYLWLGTDGGLVRFDGVRFTAFDRSTTPAFRGADFFPAAPLHVDKRGVLWISTSNGFVQYVDGTFSRAPVARSDSSFASSMFEDRGGTLWAWTLGDRIFEIRDGLFVPTDSLSGVPPRPSGVAVDAHGDLWLGTRDRRIVQVRDGHAMSTWHGAELPGSITSLFVSRDGVFWIGTGRGLGRLERGRLRLYKLSGDGHGGFVTSTAEDSTGDVWLGTGAMGVLRWHAGQFEQFGVREGLSPGVVTSLLIDNEGSVWVGTRGGLDRLRRGAVATFTPRNGGPPFSNPGPLLRDEKGRFVIGGVSAGLVAGHPGAWSTVKGATITDKVWSLAPALGGGIWIGGDSSLTLYRNGAVRRSYRPRDGLGGRWVLAVAEDSLARLWVGTDQGLFRLSSDTARALRPVTGLSHDYVRALLVDRHGTLWSGTSRGLARIERDSVRRWTIAEGLSGVVVYSLRETHDGSIWIGTSGGLTRFREGKLVAIRAEQGLPGQIVTAIEEAERNLWIATASGISRLSLAELNAVADGRAKRFDPTTFGARDGLPATEVVAAAQPVSAQTPDGRLWFSTAAGLAVIDPRHLPRNTIAPTIHIEQLSADRARLTTHGAAKPVMVPARTRRLTLWYTAISLPRPDRVTFRYRLIGYDKDWTEAPSAERTVSYTNLGPGDYTFRVIAANGDGVWNYDGASLAFTVLPAFYQTAWFRAFAVVGVITLTLGLHRARVRQLDRRAAERKRADDSLAKLRAELAQATRFMSLTTLTASIAHEVNQPLAGIVMNASTCQRMLSRDPPNVNGASAVVDRLVRDAQRASDVIARLRAMFARKASVHEPVDLNDAAREVVAMLRSELQRTHVTLLLELAETLPMVMGDRIQLQQVILNLLRNACDAVRNIADSPREIVIRTEHDEADGISLYVRDSGVGFTPDGANKLFDAFYTTKPDGMGIGLSVSRSIIENHGGRLWAAANDGPGVTVAFSIPATAVIRQPPAGVEMANPQPAPLQRRQ